MNGPGDRAARRGRKDPGVMAEVRGGDDAMFRQVGWLCDAGMVAEVSGRCDDYSLYIAADADSSHGGVREFGNTQGDIDPFVDKISVAVEQDEVHRNGREGVEIGVDDGTKDLFAADRRCGQRERPSWGGAVTRGGHLRLLDIDENAAAGGRITLADLAQLDRAGGAMKEFGADLVL